MFRKIVNLLSVPQIKRSDGAVKVITESKKKVDCYVGDVVRFKNIPCMVVNALYLNLTDHVYGLLALEGIDEGCLVKTTKNLMEIDTLVQDILIPNNKVTILGEEQAECQC